MQQAAARKDRTIYASVVVGLLGLVFFTGKAQAVNTYVSNTASTTKSIAESGQIILQKVAFPLSSIVPEWTIKTVGVYLVSGSATTITLSLKNIDGDTLASTVNNSLSSGWNYFTFTNAYVINNSTLASDTPVREVIHCSVLV